MAELGRAEVYAPKTLQVWRALLNWLGFVFQILLQLLRGTPSLPRILTSFGYRHPLLCSSPSFKPLPAGFSSEEDSIGLAAADEKIDKLTVVLDLDETLVSAYETSSLPTVIHSQATQAGVKWFELECVSVDKEDEGKQKVNHVTVFKRPGLPEFLAAISEFAELVLFTAGLEGYARPLVDRIDIENKFSVRLYCPATISIGAEIWRFVSMLQNSSSILRACAAFALLQKISRTCEGSFMLIKGSMSHSHCR